MSFLEYDAKYDNLRAAFNNTPFSCLFYELGGLIHQVINLNTQEKVFCYYDNEQLQAIANMGPLPQRKGLSLICTLYQNKMVVHNRLS
jgi:hypothetical protein